MGNKCPPREIIMKCGPGVKKVNHEGPQWKQDARFVKREGKKISIEYDCKKIPRECFK